MKQKILIVDDDFVTRRTLEKLFDQFDIVSVKTGEDCLKFIEAFSPDMVLLDIVMPGIDGYEVCKIIRTYPNMKSCKILLISGKLTLEDRLKGYDAGADDYITKPFDNNELMAKVNVFLKLKNAEDINKIHNDFLRLISHERRTPLHGIISCAEILKRNDIGTDNINLVNIIYDCGVQLLKQTDKLNLLLKLKNMPEINKNLIEIKFILDTIITKYNSNKKQIIINDINNLIENKINVDYNLIINALDLITENAVNASGENGKVIISIEFDNTFYYLSFIDNGGGIDSEIIKYIFSEFTVPNIYNHNKGWGISLLIAKTIAKLHGGDLTCNNNTEMNNKGAVFTFQIPA